jgi:PAS domain S-box-containing protein
MSSLLPANHEEQLRQSEERFRLLVESVQDYAVFMLDPEGRVASWNRGAERIKGYSAEEIIGQHFSRFYQEDAIRRGWPDYELKVARAEGRFEDEGWRVRKDGSLFWANVVITALFDEQGTLRGFAKITRDLTEKKRSEESERRLLVEKAARQAAEESETKLRSSIEARQRAEGALRESEEKLRLLVDTIPQLAWMTDPDGKVVWFNRRWYDYTGSAPETVLGEGWKSIVDPAVLPSVADRWEHSIRTGEPFDMVFPIRGAHGEWRSFLTRGRPLRDEQGRILYWFGTNTDITDRKRAEQTARFLADASAALSVLVDFDSTLQKVASLAVPHFADWVCVDVLENDGTLRRVAVAHVDPHKVQLARELHRRFPPDPQQRHGTWEILRTGKPELTSEVTPERLEESISDPELLATVRSLGLKSYIAVPLQVRGRVLGVISFMTAESGHHYDETDLAVAEDLASRAAIAIENSQLYRELRDADLRKDEFLATLAHELRNPLAPIRNGLEVLKLSASDDPMATEVHSMMDRQLTQMVRLVDDLLDVSRITRNKLELRKTDTTLAAVIQSAIETSRPVIEQARHELIVSLPSESVPIQGDPVRLAQVFSNLLNNSAKYTEPGGQIELSAAREGGIVVVRVKDTGLGMPAESLPFIFEMFSQVDRHTERSQGGLGIGLGLVRRLVQMHGGTVEARSEGLGKGSELIVRLPLAGTGETHLPADTVPHDHSLSQRIRVLVVDDNRDAALSLATMLRIMGNEASMADDGLAAIAMAESFRPDVILLDIGLPRLNGYEVCRRIRKQPWGQETLIIALTGWGQSEDRRRSQEAGFDHHLVKPVDVEHLKALLRLARKSNSAKA